MSYHATKHTVEKDYLFTVNQTVTRNPCSK